MELAYFVPCLTSEYVDNQSKYGFAPKSTQGDVSCCLGCAGLPSCSQRPSHSVLRLFPLTRRRKVAGAAPVGVAVGGAAAAAAVKSGFRRLRRRAVAAAVGAAAVGAASAGAAAAGVAPVGTAAGVGRVAVGGAAGKSRTVGPAWCLCGNAGPAALDVDDLGIDIARQQRQALPSVVAIAEQAPGLHDPASFLGALLATIGALSAALHMREAEFRRLAIKIGLIARPVTKRRPKAVDRDGGIETSAERVQSAVR